MNFQLTEEQRQIRETVHDLCLERVEPRAAAIDESGEFPWDIKDLFAKHDILGIPFPPEYGGVSGSALSTILAIEEISKFCATSSLILAVQSLGSLPITLAGSEAQKRKFLPPLARGEQLAAYALTEPGSGSDAGGMRTRATRQGDQYVISGSKTFITGGSVADIVIVFARTDQDGDAPARDISAFIVDKQSPGFRVGKLEKKLGIRGSPTAQLFFEDMVVPAANRLGSEGDGFRIAMRVLDHSRPGIAAQALGIAEGALDLARRYARERKQFGQPISAFQGIQFMLADMATQVEAARVLTYTAGDALDRRQPGISLTSSMAKLHASDTAMRVTTDAVQILGGYGYLREFPAERMMRDAKITQIYEGTNEIQRLVIARELLKQP
ncbi:MAG: acyl-CoA dehydrogenase [Chloroflexi bacterium]|nr:MAG: acyl-CoA dehydrogenase [Chloroflexota bacterium]TMG38438.1 MAG: acyl-CoA dehydrogenase [Chloroflexota bacterium]